ncbi:unnamed protein product [Paramecium primaurelia]|uniref:Uncharacterized protein n=1 Tax=Paramecium primaurelia TaxID=5886 RepID=A0A8S1PZ19_PARPR|nr:unnamed protein product [Paramecium primaurelia]
MEIQLLCLHSDHNNQQILGACLNEDCCSQRAYCQNCIEDLHINHVNDLCSLNQFELKLKEANLIIDSLSKHLQQAKNQISQIAKFQQSKIYFHQQNFNNLSHLQFNPAIDQLIAIKKIEKELIPMLQNICKNLQSITLKYEEIQNYENKQKLCREQSKLIEPLNVVFQNNVDSIDISDSGKIALKKNLGYQFVIGYPPIPLQKRVSFVFEIISVGLRTAIGICQKDINIKAQQLKEGHGSYLMVNSGNCFESTKPQGTKTAFEFQKGSKILIEVNTIQKKIIWRNLDNLNEYSVAIDISKELYPCLRLGPKNQNEPSEVRILDNYQCHNFIEK